MFLDADQTFYNYWGGSGSVAQRQARTIAKMIEVSINVDPGKTEKEK